jgi:hypothetical protein
MIAERPEIVHLEQLPRLTLSVVADAGTCVRVHGRDRPDYLHDVAMWFDVRHSAVLGHACAAFNAVVEAAVEAERRKAARLVENAE